MRSFVTPLLALLTLSSVTSPLRAQMVRGQVVDSLTRQPLAGATVTVLEANSGAVARTVADEEGLFLIRVAAPGSYRLRVEHEGYRTSTFPPFTLDGAEPKAFMLLVTSHEPPARPSAAEVIDELCGPGTVRPGLGVIAGFVQHAATHDPVANARVVASWPAPYGSLASLVDGQDLGRLGGEATTDGAGVYAFCGVPIRTPVTFHAASGELMSDFIEVQFDRGGVLVGEARRAIHQPLVRHDFQVVPPTNRSAALSGIVLNATTFQPLSAVTVGLADAELQTATDSTGAFRLNRLPAGQAQLRIRRVGFRSVTRRVNLEPEETVAFPPSALLLEPLPPELTPIVLETGRAVERAGLAEFRERRKRGGGDYLTREEFQNQGNPEVPTDVLRRMRGIRIVVGQVGGGVGSPGRRIVLSSRGQTRTIEGRIPTGERGCYPLYFLDGQSIGTSAYVYIDDILNLNEVEAVEVHTSVATLPQEFNRPGAACGVIAFWTH